MKKILMVLMCLMIGLQGIILAESTLDTVQERGRLKCGVSTGIPGFALSGEDGYWKGFDVDFCRAIAAALFNDKERVDFITTTGKTRFTLLANGEFDVLYRNSTWTLTRDTSIGVVFAGVNYYDGQGFMVPKSLGVKSAKELDGATICVQQGTTTELNVADFFSSNKMKFKPVYIETFTQAMDTYTSGRCDSYTTDSSGLHVVRTMMENPNAHVVLPEIISKEPLGPAVRDGDEKWFKLVRWTLNILIEAEELGVNSDNIDDMLLSENPAIQRLLGVNTNTLDSVGLPQDTAVRMIKAVGNYGEIFRRNLQNEDINLFISRGLNAQWNQGGILYAPPVR